MSILERLKSLRRLWKFSKATSNHLWQNANRLAIETSTCALLTIAIPPLGIATIVPIVFIHAYQIHSKTQDKRAKTKSVSKKSNIHKGKIGKKLLGLGMSASVITAMFSLPIGLTMGLSVLGISALIVGAKKSSQFISSKFSNKNQNVRDEKSVGPKKSVGKKLPFKSRIKNWRKKLIRKANQKETTIQKESLTQPTKDQPKRSNNFLKKLIKKANQKETTIPKESLTQPTKDQPKRSNNFLKKLIKKANQKETTIPKESLTQPIKEQHKQSNNFLKNFFKRKKKKEIIQNSNSDSAPQNKISLIQSTQAQPARQKTPSFFQRGHKKTSTVSKK